MRPEPQEGVPGGHYDHHLGPADDGADDDYDLDLDHGAARAGVAVVLLGECRHVEPDRGESRC